MSTTTPLRRPREGLEPTPIMLSVPSSVTSDTMAQILVVPMSNPTRICSRFATASPPLADNHAVVVAQIYVVSVVLSPVKRRHFERCSHFHKPIPLLLEPIASEVESHAPCRSHEIDGMTDIDLNAAIQGLGHPFGQLDGGLDPLLHAEIALCQQCALHTEYQRQCRLILRAKACKHDSFIISQ